MSDLNRQEICAALGCSESTIRRLEQAGLPFTALGVRSKRYNLDECKAWLRGHFGASATPTPVAEYVPPLTSTGKKPRKLRTYPS